MVGRCGPVVLDRLLTSRELADARGARGLVWTRLAGRIAAKEATKKVLGSRGQTARWTEVEVRLGSHGEPYVQLHGRTRLAAERCGLTGMLLSISHEKDVAIAVVLGW
jgi:holo-[acyl-carrier protein] synthase